MKALCPAPEMLYPSKSGKKGFACPTHTVLPKVTMQTKQIIYIEISHFQCFSLLCKMHCNLKGLSEYTNMPYKMKHVALQYTTSTLQQHATLPAINKFPYKRDSQIWLTELQQMPHRHN
jgi:hypothetical protein